MRIILPSKAVSYLEDTIYKTHPATKARSKNYIKIMTVLWGKVCREHIPFDEWMEIPAKYWRKAVSTQYNSYLKELIQSGIIEVDNSYSTIKHTSKKYRLNQDFAYSSPMLLKFKKRSEKLHNTKDPLIAQTIRNLQRIKTTFTTEGEMNHIVESEINESYLITKGLKTNYIPKTGKYYVYEYDPEKRQNGKRLSFPIAANKIWYYVHQENKIPMFWKGRIYLTNDPTEWIEKKLIEIRHYCFESLKNFRYIRNRKNIICTRNEVNRRLDTNLTNAPSVLLKYLRLDGEMLYNADLKNSQLTFFANITFALHRLDNLRAIFDQYGNDLKNVHPASFQNMTLNSIIAGMKEVEKNRKERERDKEEKREKIKKGSIRGICYSIIESEGDASFCISKDYSGFLGKKKGWFFDEIGDFRKVCFSGRFYESMASLLFKERYKNTFSNCSSFEELERKKKYARSVKDQDHGIIGGAVQLKPNLITFGKTKEAYESEFKAIRADVKLLVFQTIFSYYKFSNDLKKALEKEYPSAIYFINQFKKQYGSNQFSILLQLVESSLFIDGIYAECLSRGIIVFSKHDSILFRPSDYDTIRKIMLGYLNRFFGRGNYQISIEK